MNSQGILAIAIKQFQLIIKRQAGLGIKFNMPSMLQIHSSLTESRGQCPETKHIFMKPNIVKHEQRKPYITRARKMNWHAESIVSHLLKLNKYSSSQNKSGLLAGPRGLWSKTPCFQIPQWERMGGGNLGWNQKRQSNWTFQNQSEGWLGANREEEKR